MIETKNMNAYLNAEEGEGHKTGIDDKTISLDLEGIWFAVFRSKRETEGNHESDHRMEVTQ